MSLIFNCILLQWLIIRSLYTSFVVSKAMCCGRICVFLLLVLQAKTFKVAVTVKQGVIVGTREATIFDKRLYYAFYGVPYAQPPTGRLRFLDPKPPKIWKRPYDARMEFHGACAQAHIVHKQALYGNEDCLNMNIFTPYLPNKGQHIYKPVIVWFHGHAFTSSFSHIYGADFLIDNDVLFVSVTHRLGVFGFFKLNETDFNANMGLKDIVMALKWLKRNIEKFGGDKKRITVMGSDSAATFLSLLLTTKYKKLFAKMILQSGGIFSPSIFQGSHNTESVRLRKQLQIITQLDVKKAPAKDIITSSLKIYNNKDIINFQKSIVPFSPIIEKKSNNSLIFTRPQEFASIIQNLSIPILIGFTSQESIPEVIPFLHNPRHLRKLAGFFNYMVPFIDGCNFHYTSKIYKEVSEKIKNKYFRNGISENSIDNFMEYVSDLRKFPIYKFIDTYLKNKDNKMYVYKFDYVGKLNAVKTTSTSGINLSVKGAANGDELCYILKCEPLWEIYKELSNNTENRDQKLIKVITKLWANFAKSSDPTSPVRIDKVVWLPMTSIDDNVLLISRKIKLIDSKSEKNMFSFWNDIYKSYYSDEHCDNKENHDEL